VDASSIPAHLLPAARKWFASQVAEIRPKHGKHWQEHKEWVYDYLMEELGEMGRLGRIEDLS